MLKHVTLHCLLVRVFTVDLISSRMKTSRHALHAHLVQFLTEVPRPASAQRMRLTFQSQMPCNVFVVLDSNHQQKAVLLAQKVHLNRRQATLCAQHARLEHSAHMSAKHLANSVARERSVHWWASLQIHAKFVRVVCIRPVMVQPHVRCA